MSISSNSQVDLNAGLTPLNTSSSVRSLDGAIGLIHRAVVGAVRALPRMGDTHSQCCWSGYLSSSINSNEGSRGPRKMGCWSWAPMDSAVITPP